MSTGNYLNKGTARETQESEQTNLGSPAESPKSKKTGAKTVAKAISVIALTTGLIAGSIYGAKVVYPEYQENKRVEQLISSNLNEDSICRISGPIMIDKAYDIAYADGETIADKLKDYGVKYCELLDQYYTIDGSDIAILTYDVVTTETIDAVKTEINGTAIYLAPEGYTLQKDKCYREITNQVTKIVPKSKTGDYSNVKISGVTSFELVDVQEIKTATFDSISDYTLICDVPDEAVLNQDGLCEANLTLKKH